MIKIISTIFFSFCFAGNPVHEWIKSQSDFLSREIKTVSFKISIQNEMTNKLSPEQSWWGWKLLIVASILSVLFMIILIERVF